MPFGHHGGMDDIVKAAMAKWPRVPHCHGWLALDTRGHWYMRDDRIQALGPFPAVKGSRIEHEKLQAFIHRNYLHDGAGAWYFQNGPQRVYVDLEAAPWIWRVEPDGRVSSHTGIEAQVHQGILDEHGRLFLVTDLGIGLVHTQDMHRAADAIEQGRWPEPREQAFATLPGAFGYVLQPRTATASKAETPKQVTG